jgi:Co/Zn/Cd efflux system component
MKTKKDSATLNFISFVAIATICTFELFQRHNGASPAFHNIMFCAAVVGFVANLLALIRRHR